MDLYLVTSNSDKLREAERILGIKIRVADIELDELQELDPIKIAEHKARQAWEHLHEPLVVWDQSVYCSCLNGFPGPLIKWFWTSVGLERITRIAKLLDDQRVYTETMLTYYDGTRMQHFTGRVDGTIPDTPRGTKGWGWDPMFIPNGETRTYAEMDPGEVVRFRSHRIALERLRDFLRQHEPL